MTQHTLSPRSLPLCGSALPTDISPLQTMSQIQRVSLLGLRFHVLTERECLSIILDELEAGNGGWVITANLDHLRRYVIEEEYRTLCEDADLIVADGRPIQWAARLQGTVLPDQVAGSNLIWRLSQAAPAQGRSVYLLGGEEGTAQAAAEILQTAFPGLVIAGTYFPEYGFENDTPAIEQMKQSLISTAPDIVYVALGSPKQERLIQEFRSILPDAWWIGVGISFSFVSGKKKRAPRWISNIGLEWLHRLVQEPRRLFRRYVLQGIPFAARLFTVALISRFLSSAEKQGEPQDTTSM